MIETRNPDRHRLVRFSISFATPTVMAAQAAIHARLSKQALAVELMFRGND